MHLALKLFLHMSLEIQLIQGISKVSNLSKVLRRAGLGLTRSHFGQPGGSYAALRLMCLSYASSYAGFFYIPKTKVVHRTFLDSFFYKI